MGYSKNSGSCSYIGKNLVGKYGVYSIKAQIGKGGNGKVFSVEVKSGGDRLPHHSNGYAIKIFDVEDKNRIKERMKRFKKEINCVLELKDKVQGIMPIYDASILVNANNDILWYLMPKAATYDLYVGSVAEKLSQMYSLGLCLMELHKLGYAHRDIKPKNLLTIEDRIYLSDFGLVWNKEFDEQITELNECIGPAAIRPPELRHILDYEDVDYRKSDVYLFAKTLWMVLRSDNYGFKYEYFRESKGICFDKNNLKMESVEPLHDLMEKSTKHDYWDRIDICDCLHRIKEQISILKGEIDADRLKELKFSEQTRYIASSIKSDIRVYRDPLSILSILNRLSGIVSLVFTDAGKEYGLLPLLKSSLIRDNAFEIEIRNPYYMNGSKKKLEICIDSICITDGTSSYEINTRKHIYNESDVKTFERIIPALECPDKRVRLNADYQVKLILDSQGHK